jgi:hypothetical protein
MVRGRESLGKFADFGLAPLPIGGKELLASLGASRARVTRRIVSNMKFGIIKPAIFTPLALSQAHDLCIGSRSTLKGSSASRGILLCTRGLQCLESQYSQIVSVPSYLVCRFHGSARKSARVENLRRHIGYGAAGNA